jgi:formylglycine-generating enzyme required for sulfatase activity
VREWTAGTLRPWTGFTPDAWTATAELDGRPFFARARVQRGGSFASRTRMKNAKARWWALPERDDGFVGFRTCAL